MKAIAWNQKQQRKNREAEESWVRRNHWGEQEASNEEVGDVTYLGDVTEQHYHQPKRGSSLLKNMALAGIAAAGLGVGAAAPIAAYKWATSQPTIEQASDAIDTDTQYGLRIYRDE